MDRDVLQGFLEEGLSLEEIGRRLGRHPSTVRYWITKYGLEHFVSRRNMATGAIAREDLEQLIGEGLTIREIAARIGTSYTATRYWLQKHDLQTSGGRHIEVLRESRAVGRRTIVRRCSKHGVTEFGLEGRGLYRCLRCRAERVSKRRRRVKAILVEEAGGCCRLCGYDRCTAALHFHHVDPASKSFAVGYNGVTRSLERARAEAKKCVLLCANCHAEVETGVTLLG